MKYLLVLAVVWVAYAVWRNNRMADKAQARPPAAPRPLQPPTAMVACLHCGTHLPHHEALTGRQGVYCSAEHRQLHEGA